MVRVSKRGYYQYTDAWRGFQYGGPGDEYTPDAKKPEIFRLRKKGVEEPLVQDGSLFGFPIDGAEQSIDFFKKIRKPGRFEDTDLIVSFHRNGKDVERTLNWSVKFEIPKGGGLIESDEEFMFMAPESGYRAVYELKNLDTPREEKKFYIKLPENQGYARVEMAFMPDYNDSAAIDMKYFINPTSRNLEYDHGWSIQVKWRRDDSVELVYPTPEEQHLADEREARQEKADASKP